MARYNGPVCKLCRRQGEKLMLKGERCVSSKCTLERRSYPPGEHGNRRRQRRLSDRGLQLRGKQKVRHIYGVLERQFRGHFASAEKRPGLTGENLLQILETRLDSIVFRLGFADSRRQARQIVCHGHIMLNGRKTDIPSCHVKPGDVITWKENKTKSGIYKLMSEIIQDKEIPSWLNLDAKNMTGQVLAYPSRSDIDATIQEQLVVEYYSR
ncbi:MAG: 30S ribosomal protein S4 [bacterium]|jgi:small subunit ribosomal protein S4|nr:30S ribosomal protein S4 [bacterium]